MINNVKVIKGEKHMKKILYIATTADNRNRLDGETVKNRLLKEYLTNIADIEVYMVDTDNWQSHIIKLIYKIMTNLFKCDTIIISSADKGANIILNFFSKVKIKKDIYYFVTGGSLSTNIIQKKWNKYVYCNLKHIYVEANALKNDLNKLGINNVEVINNFRKVNEYDNKYKEDKSIKFVYYGRVIKEKGIEEAIKLIKRLNKENIECTLDIYGQCQKQYLQEIQNYFDSSIIYHGEITPNNKTEYEILSQYDIFIFPTEYSGECLPGALIDCYIAGLAVIASEWKYAREYILDNQNGKIFKYKDYNDMYIKTIELIKENKILEFKQKSKYLAQKYNIEDVLAKFKKELIE